MWRERFAFHIGMGQRESEVGRCFACKRVVKARAVVGLLVVSNVRRTSLSVRSQLVLRHSSSRNRLWELSSRPRN
jgi:hypothetical protein